MICRIQGTSGDIAVYIANRALVETIADTLNSVYPKANITTAHSAYTSITKCEGYDPVDVRALIEAYGLTVYERPAPEPEPETGDAQAQEMASLDLLSRADCEEIALAFGDDFIRALIVAIGVE